METTNRRHTFATAYLAYCFFLFSGVFAFCFLGNGPLAQGVATNWPVTVVCAIIPIYFNLSPLKCLALAMPLFIGTMATQSYIAYDIKSFNPDNPLSTTTSILTIVFYFVVAHAASLIATALTKYPAGEKHTLTFIWDNPPQAQQEAAQMEQTKEHAERSNERKMDSQDKNEAVIEAISQLTTRGEAITEHIRTAIKRTSRFLVILYLTLPVTFLIGAIAITRNEHAKLALAIFLAIGNIFMALTLRRQRRHLQASLRQAENTVARTNIALLAAKENKPKQSSSNFTNIPSK